MKKIFLTFVLAIFCFSIFAQQATTYKSKISLQAGSSFLGLVVNQLNVSNYASLNSSFASPVGQLTYNYFIEPKFSLGAVVSYQYYSFDLQISTVDAFEAKLNRISAGIRASFHYVNTDKLNLYSGLKIGGTFWKLNAKSDALKQFLTLLPVRIPINPEISLYQIGFSPQLVLFGLDFYFTKNFGINGEICLGPVYSIAGGVTARF